MCDKVVADFIPALNFVLDWFATSKMIKKLHTALYILLFDADSRNVAFCCNEMGNPSVDLNNINLDDIDYDEDDPEIIIYIKLLAWHSKTE